MSSITLLPLMRVADGVQSDEDWRLSIAFYLEDGVTPTPLDGLAFTLDVGAFATLSSIAGQISIAGPADNVLVLTVLAAEKTGWPTGVFSISLSVTDGVVTRDLFARSTLSVGSSQVTRLSLVVAPDNLAHSVATPLPAALAAVFQAIQPAALASAITGLTNLQLSALTQAVFAALPIQTGSAAPVPAGQAFVNSSGYVVIAQ